jgi:radical SAM-linked protein
VRRPIGVSRARPQPRPRGVNRDMASDRPQADQSATAARPRASDKARIRFRKDGDLRFVSHRDLMKCFERVLRRAHLPVHATQGFHPMPRMIFAMSLGLGILGAEEILELEFDEPIEPGEVQRRLAAQMPPGLEILDVQRIDVKSSARVRRTGYRARIPAERAAELPARIDGLLTARELWVERTRPAPRRFDLRPLLSELRVNDQMIEMLLWVTPHGAARPDEVLGLLGLGDLVEAGVPLERHRLELCDEIHDPGLIAEANQGGPRHEPQDHPAAGPRDADRPARPTALVSGPLSFDS